MDGDAIPLQQVLVSAVGSSFYGGYENINKNQYYTSHEHGGPQLYVVTVEIGIGREGIAEMNGNRLKKIGEERIVQNGKIIGFYKIWDASRYGTGKFTYENTSMSHPWNTERTYIYIK
ncbi:MAG: DUF4879 domain-containing protein [Treponema sp.]|nr:DUF4879 domain-containing protein [Treponema sp.]